MTKKPQLVDEVVYSHKWLVADFLHSFFDYQSETIENYYPKWLDNQSFILADEKGDRCLNPSIYHLLDEYQKNYAFTISDDLVCKLKDS